MKFGFFMMPLHHPSENPTMAFERDLDFIEYVDHLGFDECFIGEHHSAGWETIPAPDIFIATAAARTKRITLGAGVINLPYHHPFHVGEQMTFLDHLTRGRLVMGVGPGVLATDLMLFGLPMDQVRPMSSEARDIIIRPLESDGPITQAVSYNSLELFARYVMPTLQGTSASIQRAWEKTQRWNEEGIIAGYRQGMKRSDGGKSRPNQTNVILKESRRSLDE